MSAPELAVAKPARLDVRERFDRGLGSAKRAVGGFSVRTKILGIILALTTVLGLVVTLEVRSVMSDVLASEFDDRGIAIADAVAARVGTALLVGDTDAISELLSDEIASHPDAIYAVVLDANGQVLADTFGDEGLTVDLSEGQTSASQTTTQYLDFEIDVGAVHEFEAPIIGGTEGVVRLALSESRSTNLITGLTNRVVMTMVLVGLIGVAAASVLTWLLTRPIADLVDVTRDVGCGDISAPARRWSGDEIGALGLAFDRMAIDLKGSQQTIAENEAVRTRLLEQLIHAQEAERKRIARDLHDTVGQALSSMMVGMAALTQSGADETVVAKRKELQQLAEETLDQVRQMSRELRPSALDDLGLAAALNLYSQDFGVLHPHMSVDLHVELPSRLAPTTETNLYRIVQEAMTNAARHGASHQLSVVVTMRGGRVRAIVEDDGEGFDPVAVRKSGQSVGIHGMQERAEILGGRIAIESGRDGTTVFVEVPT